MKIKKRSFIILSIIGTIILIALSLFVNAQPTYEVYHLKEGKNIVSFHEPSFAREILNKNPEIVSISYFDMKVNATLGFVNAFGGIGKNFLIIPGEPYEIFVKQNVTLAL